MEYLKDPKSDETAVKKKRKRIMCMDHEELFIQNRDELRVVSIIGSKKLTPEEFSGKQTLIVFHNTVL